MEILTNIMAALPYVFAPMVVASMVLGVIIGITVGALPGLSATMAIAVLIPLTFAMDPLVALGMIAGIYNGSMYGSSIPAILLRIPGTPAGIATVFDGYPMSQQGLGKLALSVSLVSSTFGSGLSAIALIAMAPPLAALALKFSPADYFWLAVFGMTTIVVLLSDNPVKGFLSACFGLIVGMVGIDPLSGAERFAFNNLHLLGGIHIVIMLTGLYAIPPAIDLAVSGTSRSTSDLPQSDRHSNFRLLSLFPVWIKSSIIGIIIGIIPALGGNVAALLAWNEQRRSDKNKEKYGKGAPEGVAAAESANNADTSATLIPALTLGIPGSAVAAVILGAMLVHGLQPGPELFQKNSHIVYGFMIAMLLSSGLLFIIGRLGAKAFINVLKMPPQLLAPIILTMTLIGAYAIHNSMFDVFLMIVFGLIGFGMERLSIPTTPAVLAVILGPMAEESLRRALLISAGSFAYLFESVISWIIIIMTCMSFIMPIYRYLKDRKAAQQN